MGKDVDCLQRLPVELHELILDYLHYNDWHELRLVSRQWHCMCQRRIWRTVAIGTGCSYVIDRLETVMTDYVHIGRPWLKVKEETDKYKLVHYQQLKNLVSNQQFRATVSKNTVEMAVFYNGASTEEEEDDKHAHEIISVLFKQVRKVRIWYEPGPRDDRFLAFQSMLDALKPIAEFYLAIDYHLKDLASLDIDDMNIKDLFIKNECHYSEVEIQLPLWRSKDRTPIKWSDLAVLCKNLVTLKVFTTNDIFRSCWMPDSIKYLRLINGLGENYTPSGKILVPSGVEFLSVSDLFNYNGSGSDPMASILVCVDLSTAKQLERIQYCSYDASNLLIQTILSVKNSLEWLSIRCEQVTRFSTYEFLKLSSAGLGIKRLDLVIGSFGKKLSDYQNFDTLFQELELLKIDVNNYDQLSQCEIHCGYNFIKGLVASFLNGSPKLSRIQLIANQKLTWVDNLMPWITRTDRNTTILYDVDVVEARSSLLK
ncbi:hypothetical protein TRVA0_015S00760 [Trichomonascus vanleenenianus]|uniref:F-box protein n=1 Tax=Trichomonascus vanleenenianus TaxID=2268995 RepID=UPI003ECAF71C